MKISRFLKTTLGRITIDTLLVTAICLVIVLPITLGGNSNISTKSFNLNTIGSTSVLPSLNTLITNPNNNGFADIMNEIFSIEVNYQASHTGSGAAFSTDPIYSETFLGFQSSSPSLAGLSNWGYLNKDQALYDNWELDAIAVLLNKASVEAGGVIGPGQHYNFQTKDEIKNVYTNCPTMGSTPEQIAQNYNFVNPFKRAENSGASHAFEDFIGWTNNDFYCSGTVETSSQEDLLIKVGNTSNSVGYASVMSFTDGLGNIKDEYNDLHLASFNNVVPTLSEIISGNYNFTRPFNVFFRVKEEDSSIWQTAMYNPNTGWDKDALQALSSKPTNMLGAFLFQNWILFSEQANQILSIPGTDSAIPGPNTNWLDFGEIANFIYYTGFLK